MKKQYDIKTLQVNVTAEHIADGERKSCCSCPIALAINTPVKDGYPLIEYASIHLTGGWFTYIPQQRAQKTRFKFNLPPAAREFVKNYSNNEPVSPISFELHLKSAGVPSGQGTI